MTESIAVMTGMTTCESVNILVEYRNRISRNNALELANGQIIHFARQPSQSSRIFKH